MFRTGIVLLRCFQSLVGNTVQTLMQDSVAKRIGKRNTSRTRERDLSSAVYNYVFEWRR